MDVYLKLFGTLLLSSGIFFVMMRIQKRKEKEADDKFHFTLKCNGLNPNVEENNERN